MDGRELKTRDAMKRNYGVDLLRLLAMFMVLCLHVYGHGGILERLPQLSAKYETVWLVECLCICCLNCYMLISGYVGVCARYRYSNLALLWLRVLFYSLLITAAAKLFLPSAVGLRDWVQSLLPVLFNRYWFFTAYFAVFLMMPLLNTACTALSKQQLGSVLCGLLVFLSVLPTILHQDPFYTNFGSSAIWFAIAYLIGAYIRLYGLLQTWSRAKLFFLYLAGSVGMWLFKLLFEAGTARFLGNARVGNHLFVHVSPLVLLAAVALLLLFERLTFSEKNTKLISDLTPLAFSVYLIHEHPLFRTQVIGRLAFLADCAFPLMLLGHLAAVLVLYMFCLGVDTIREALFRRLKISEKLRKMEERLLPTLWKK